MRFTINLLFLAMLSISIGCQASSSGSSFPQGCIEKELQFNGKNIALSIGSKQSLYLFHNISDKSFWLNHAVGKDPGASAGWASEIAAGNWSAITISNTPGEFVMNCSEIGDGGVDYLDCRNVVKACRLIDAKFSSENSGSYWIAENKSLNSNLAAITSKGISW